MQLIPQDESKRWLIYKGCLFVVYVAALLTSALFLVLMIYPHDQNKQVFVGMPCFGSWIFMLFAFAIMRRLYLTKHFEASSYSLPYKLSKDKGLAIFFAGCAIVTSALYLSKGVTNPKLLSPLMVISTDSSRIVTIPGWVLLPLLVCIVMLFLYLILAWQGAILYTDHLHWFGFGSKEDVSYDQVKGVEVEKSNGSGASCILRLSREHKPPYEINLAPYTNSSIIIMLNVLHQYAPNATMNELAEMMRQGDFPIMWGRTKSPFTTKQRD